MQIDCHVGFKGFAQGSLLSPLLNNVYTINLEKLLVPNVNILQYADDVVLYLTNSNNQSLSNNIQLTLDIIFTWYIPN